jgi:hypothetical protein
MPSYSSRRLGLCAALLFGCSPILFSLVTAAPEASKPAKELKTEFFTGKVVPLADLLKKSGVQLDADAAPSWLALASENGKTYPLIKDDGARMFFKDARLLNRRVRLTAKLLPESQLLQVVEVHSYHKDELHEVYYWCDICRIKRYEKKDCDCCGGPMELREEPLKK